MRRIDFGDISAGKPKRSLALYPAFSDTYCEICGNDIWEDDSVGFVDGDKACEDCWEEAG